MTAAAVLAAALVAWPRPALAQTGCAKLEAQWGYGLIYALTVVDGLAYYSMGADLLVADVRRPGRPVVLGRVSLPYPNFPTEVVHDRGHLFAACSHGLVVVDVADATRPEVVAFVPGFYPYALGLAGHFLYALEAYQRLYVLDVSDPARPLQVAELALSGLDIEVAGRYAYVAEPASVATAGLHILDLADPAHPVEVAYQYLWNYKRVKVSGKLLYLGGAPGLRIFDLSDPTNPVEVGSCDPPGDVRGMALDSGMVYLAGHSEGLRVVDARNPSAPFEVGSYDPGVAATAVTLVEGSRALVGTEFAGLREVLVEKPSDPLELGSYAPARLVVSVATAGDNVLVADDLLGLRVMAGNGGAALDQVGQLALPDGVLDLAASSGVAYALYKRDLTVIDVSDPANPWVVGQTEVPYPAGAVMGLVGQRAVTASGKVAVFDLANPSSPTCLGTGWMSDPIGGTHLILATDIALTPTHAFVSVFLDGGWWTTSSYSLHVVDISYPAAPQEVAVVWDGVYLPKGVAFYQDFLYVPTESYGVVVMDVTNPASPVVVGHTGIDSFIGGVARVAQGQLFVVNSLVGVGVGRLHVFDLADPVHPMPLGMYTNWAAADVAVANGRAFVADLEAGVQKVRVDACETVFTSGFESGSTAGWSRVHHIRSTAP